MAASLVDLLLAAAARDPDKMALRRQRAAWTYGDLTRGAAVAAAALRACRARAGRPGRPAVPQFSRIRGVPVRSTGRKAGGRAAQRAGTRGRAGRAGGAQRRPHGGGRSGPSGVAGAASRIAGRGSRCWRCRPTTASNRRPRSRQLLDVPGTAKPLEAPSVARDDLAILLYTSGHHGPAEGRHAESWQPGRQQRRDPGLPRSRARGRRAHGDAVPFLVRQLGAAHAPGGRRDAAARGQPCLSTGGGESPPARPGDGVLRRPVDLRDPHVALPPRGLRPQLDALPHAGGRCDDTRGDPAHAPAGAERKVLRHVWPDRGHRAPDLPAARAPRRAPGLHRHSARRDRDPGSRPAGRGAASRTGGRVVRSGPEHHAGILARRRGDKPRRRGWLAAHGRPRASRTRRGSCTSTVASSR